MNPMNSDLVQARRLIVQGVALLGYLTNRIPTLEARNLQFRIEELMTAIDDLHRHLPPAEIEEEP